MFFENYDKETQFFIQFKYIRSRRLNILCVYFIVLLYFADTEGKKNESIGTLIFTKLRLTI